jgi:hypothetical protein
MTNRYLYITLLAVLGFGSESFAQELRNAPRLVVNITIDQLRSDYLEAFLPLYSDKGFKLMMEQGCVYPNASYPFAPIDRASAIASLTTGVTPYYNKIIGERWLSRETLRPVYCVNDNEYTGLNTKNGSSPKNLSTSTLGDELKVATAGRGIVYAIAPFRDAAVLSAGHAADGAFWLDDNSGDWCSSQYYFSSFPAWANAFNTLHAPSRKLQGVSWEPINNFVGQFSYFMQKGAQDPFKHTFKGDDSYHEYKLSGLINEDITNLAQQCIASCGMGNDQVTDLLNITYYAGTFNHQTVTECQMEVQDTYVRLDQELGRLIQFCQSRLGTDRVLFVMTSTGYGDEETSDYQKYRIPSGTFYMSRTANLLNMFFGAIWGPDKYVEAHYRNQIYLNHQLLEKKKITIAEATNRAQEILAMMSGVRNVYTSLQLLTDNNEHLRKVRNGFNAELCGDLVIETAPGWYLLDEDTQESEQSRASYIPFPIVFYGNGIQAERINTPVTIDRIAPTIAKNIRIRAPNACSVAPLF